MQIIERLVFVCPFCGKRAAVVDVLDGHNLSGNLSARDFSPGVTHVEPYCQTFAEKEPHDFLAACNVAIRAERKKKVN